MMLFAKAHYSPKAHLIAIHAVCDSIYQLFSLHFYRIFSSHCIHSSSVLSAIFNPPESLSPLGSDQCSRKPSFSRVELLSNAGTLYLVAARTSWTQASISATFPSPNSSSSKAPAFSKAKCSLLGDLDLLLAGIGRGPPGLGRSMRETRLGAVLDRDSFGRPFMVSYECPSLAFGD